MSRRIGLYPGRTVGHKPITRRPAPPPRTRLRINHGDSVGNQRNEAYTERITTFTIPHNLMLDLMISYRRCPSQAHEVVPASEPAYATCRQVACVKGRRVDRQVTLLG